MSLAHLHVHTPFSFLDGASDIRALVSRAAVHGLEALAVTDHDNLSAAVKFHRLARAAGLKPIQGVEVTLENGSHLVLLAKGPRGYRSLCRILSDAHLSSERRAPRVSFANLRANAEDLFATSGCRRGEIPSLLLKGKRQEAREAAGRYASLFGRQNFLLELQTDMLPGERRLNALLAELACSLGLDVVVGADVHYARKEDFRVHDVLTCIRTLTRLEEIHPERKVTAENYLKPAVALERVAALCGQVRPANARVVEECAPALEPRGIILPSFPLPDGVEPAELLRSLAYAGALSRYGRIDGKITARLEHELEVICRLGYAPYFLVVWDIVQAARKRGIRHGGRGSAADSAVAYCLGLTEVDSLARGLLFERFLSLERRQKPDIDLDFDARHRDEIMACVCAKYGGERVANVCTYSTFQARAAFRDVARAMGFPEEEVGPIARKIPHMPADCLVAAMEKVPELRDSHIPRERYGELLKLCEAIAGFPRFLGTHLGGIIIADSPLRDFVPLQKAAKGVTVTQFDKEDIEEVGFVKLDLLCLRTLSAVEDAVKMINAGGRNLDYEKIPLDDPETYRMIGAGETIGVFQLESPAQRALHPRLGADKIEDVIASVALIRPGPIKGNMVEPFVARRRGVEDVTYLDPRLKPILGKTYGVVLFQEQVIEVATVIAGFSPGEADRLRRVMTHARSPREMEEIGELFRRKAVENGTDPATAEKIFSCLAGYASYGFCEAHAAAFGTTAFKTAYLVRHYPAEFYAAILSNQPMGYYPPDTICVEARRRGVRVLPPDVNRSEERFTVEDGNIRSSLGAVKGMTSAALASIISTRRQGPFRSVFDFCRRSGIDRDIVENLVLCGAFDSLNPNRRGILWNLADVVEQARLARAAASKQVLELFCGAPEECAPGMKDFSPEEKFFFAYDILGFNPGGHLLEFFRDRLEREGFVHSATLRGLPAGEPVRVAGVMVRPHRPPTKSGRTVVFLSLEDEFGLADVTVFENVYQKYGVHIFGVRWPALAVAGQVARRGNAVSVTASILWPLR